MMAVAEQDIGRDPDDKDRDADANACQREGGAE